MNALTPVQHPHVRPRIQGVRLRWLVPVVAVALVGGPAYLLQVSGGAPNNPGTTVERGIDLMYSITVVTQGARAADISQGQMAAHSKAVPGLLRKYFAGAAFERMSSSLAQAMDDEVSAGVRDVKGGAKEVDILSLQANGDSADAKARALISLETRGVTPNTPAAGLSEGWWDFTLHLIRESDGWRIDDWDAEPEAGAAP